MFQAQHYAHIQQSTQTTQTTNQRRNPFANAAVNHVNHQQTPPKPPQKVPASPPLPRQNSKTTPPSPPKIITDKSGRFRFSRVGFLGEVSGSEIWFRQRFNSCPQGGFARVYEVKDTRGTRFACKVITKSSLMTKKAKTKVSKHLWSFSLRCYPHNHAGLSSVSADGLHLVHRSASPELLVRSIVWHMLINDAALCRNKDTPFA